jgi:hypothetical protein
VAAVEEWLDEAAAAAWLGVPACALRSAVAAGEVPALTIGGHVRISRDALLKRAELAGVPAAPPPTAVAAADAAGPVPWGALPVPAGMAWVQELGPTTDFPFRWPNGSRPLHTNALVGVVSLHGERVTIRIGDAVRFGRPRRTVVGKRFVCEFAETADGSAWASLIKPDGRTTLPLSAPPPPLYQNARLGNWRAVTGWQTGGHPEALAVLIGKDDLRSIVHHAVTRGLARKHHLLAPAS